MNTFTLVWQHDFISAVRISIEVVSPLAPATAARDASALMEEADDVVEGASLDLRDYTLIAVVHGPSVIAWFTDDTRPVRQPLTAEEIAREDEERDNQ